MQFRPRPLFSAVSLALLSMGASSLQAAEGVDKSAYSLLNPTPRDQMREMQTDRPDKTEGATTVDAGHLQIETDLYNGSFEKVSGSDIKERSTEILTSNLRLGLTDNLEFNFILSPWLQNRVETGGQHDTEEGFGDTTVRLKYNFMGNEGAPVAIGLIPFVKFPTAHDGLGNDKVEGGLILPIGLSLPNAWGLGMMFEIDSLKNDADDHYHNAFISSASVSHAIFGELEGYLEFYNEVSSADNGGWVATFDAGVTYGLSKNLQLDAGCNFGITRAADDTNPFVGISARI